MTVVEVYPYDAVNGPGAAVIFSDSDCYNETWTIFSGDVGEVKYYNRDALEERGYCNDCASSIMVPVGFTVTLYEDDGFSGSQYVV